MTLATLERLQAAAQKQFGWEVATTVTVTPGELAELCRLARIGMAVETAASEAKA